MQQALGTALAEVRAIAETELVDLTHAAGRILAQTLKADAVHPRFDCSAMDGYAVDTFALPSSFPVRLKVSGSVAADRIVETVPLQPGCAIRILTGASIPAGANAVIAQEDVRCEAHGIVLSRAPLPFENAQGVAVIGPETQAVKRGDHIRWMPFAGAAAI